MKDFLLIFLLTLFILFAGIYFGFDQLKNPYVVSSETRMLSEPFSDNIDREFLKNLKPAL